MSRPVPAAPLGSSVALGQNPHFTVTFATGSYLLGDTLRIVSDVIVPLELFLFKEMARALDLH